MIFQSICHPHFLPSSAGSGTDVMADTGGLLSLRACACVCTWSCAYACKRRTIPAFVICGNRVGGRRIHFVFCFFLISVCGRSLYSRGVGLRAACLCACVRKCVVVLNLSRQTVTICRLETPADITHQTL